MLVVVIIIVVFFPYSFFVCVFIFCFQILFISGSLYFVPGQLLRAGFSLSLPQGESEGMVQSAGSRLMVYGGI